MDPSAQKTFPIISCWVALDDVTISNGTLLIEPFPKVSTGDPSFAALAENPLDNIESYLQYFQHLASCYGPEMDRDKAMAEVKAQKLTRGLEGTRHGNLIEMEKQEYHNDVPQGEGAGEGSRGICRDPYVLVEAPAGSIVFLSGFVRHCSFGNASSTFRRVFMPQYSIGKVESEDGGLISLAVPCSDHLHG
ncbi:hypothetical protein BX616_010581 [Lobosporangium transversale]|nr:hypothetical protein BX616_010581 [Lobosporangium transversale]